MRTSTVHFVEDIFSGIFKEFENAVENDFNLSFGTKDNQYYVFVDMAGVSKESIDVSIKDGILSISAERKKDPAMKYQHERIPYGKLSSSVRLSRTVDTSEVDAEYKDGILTVTLSKSEKDTTKIKVR